MGLFGSLLGKSGAAKVQKKMKADEESRKKIHETQEREDKASKISKQYGVSMEDARDFVSSERRKEKGKENLAKLKGAIKSAQEWKKKHIIPIKEGHKKARTPKSVFGGGVSMKPTGSVLTWGKPKKRR